MHAPERRLGDEHIFQGDALAVEKLNELRTQIVAFAKVAFFYRRAFVIVLAAQVFAFFLPFTPFGKAVGGVSVYASFTDDADVVLAVSIDKGAVIVDESAFPTGFYDG